MKKMSLLLFVLLLLTACSKDKKINRQLDGNWYATMYENIVVSPQISYKFNFDKERNGKGTGNYSISYPGFFSQTEFVYEINDENIRLTSQDANGVTIVSTYKVESHSKTRMIFVNLSSENQLIYVRNNFYFKRLNLILKV